MDRLLTIAEYLKQTSAAAFVWGKTDCALWCADLVLARLGFDPAALMRGTYDSRFTCFSALHREGGLERVVRAGMAGIPHGERVNGVALVRCDGGMRCGILSGGRLWIKMHRGIRSPQQFTIVEGWSV